MLQPVPADELGRGKSYVALGLPSGFETTGDISRRLEESFIYGLPDDYYTQYVPKIEAVSPADVQRIARTYLPTARMAVVVVGDRAKVEAGIKALNLGPITVMTIDEIFGK
jgi:zinc protease